MSDFTNGLDDGFIRFSETPQALEKGRSIQIQSAVFIIVIQLFFVFIPFWPIRILLFILMLFVIVVRLNQQKVIIVL